MESANITRATDRKKRTRSAHSQQGEADVAAHQHPEQHAAGGSAEAKSGARNSHTPATRPRSASFEGPAKKGKKRKTAQSTKLEPEVVELSPDPIAGTPGADAAATAAVEHGADAGPSSSPQATDELAFGATATDKGKTKAEPSPPHPQMQEVRATTGEPQDLQQEIERLKKELSTKNGLITAQRSTISHIYHQCTCTICLELVWRPFILAPCGHIFCVVCLMSWFTKPLEKEGELPPRLNDAERAREVQRRTQRRKKTCPACRTELACAPVEVWLVKGMLEKLDAAARVVGTSDCGLPDDTVSSLEIAKARGENLPAGSKLWEDVFDGRGPRRILYDEGDGVRRCGECASEIWDGQCSNPDCAIEYSDMSDEYGSDLMPSDNVYGHYANPNGRRARSPGSDRHDDSRSENTQFSDSEDDMRSFIEDDLNDDNDNGGGSGPPVLDSEEDDDGFIAGPRRVYRYDRADPIEISDDEVDEDDENFIRDGSSDDGSRGRRESTMSRDDDDDDHHHHSMDDYDSHGGDDDDDGRGSIDDGSVVSYEDYERVGDVGASRRSRRGAIVDSEDSDGDESRRSAIDVDMSSESVRMGGSDVEGGGYETADASHSSDGSDVGRSAARARGGCRIIDDSDQEEEDEEY